ncbi:MAG: transposase zinc-binding domain-containing protein [Acidobacteria bacterium]|nr:transposase zinc-binding domain-containing protein [Acidobacteriota bacterium]
MRSEVTEEFRKVVECRTLALGAEVYSSESGEEKVVPHTCKSRMCPSCARLY